jgi:large subunit ribosomal protein L6
MSKIGHKPILLPVGTKITISGGKIIVEGPKGSLNLDCPGSLQISQQDNQLIIKKKNEETQTRMMHGTIRQLLANMVIGVNNEWSKKLQVIGTGYVAQMKGKDLNLSLGLSHQVDFPAPQGIRFEANDNIITVSGVDRQQVGQVAYKIRSLRPPDAYKGKGIRYLDEEIKLKAGKAAKVGEGSSE